MQSGVSFASSHPFKRLRRLPRPLPGFAPACSVRYSSAPPIALSHPHSPSPTDRHLSSPGYGQPLPITHPHLLSPGQLTVGISAKEYEQRRRRLMEGLEDGALVIVAGGRMKYLSGNIFYKFRQSTNFWYLTGWQEPDSVLVLEKNSSPKGYKMTLFCPSKDVNDEMWNGPRSGREGAIEVFGADDATDISLLSSHLSQILSSNSSFPSPRAVYVDAPGVVPNPHSRPSPRASSRTRSLLEYLVPSGAAVSAYEGVKDVLEGGQRGKWRVLDAAKEVEKLRLIKSEAEVHLMRRAAQISAEAHAKVMRFASPTSESGLTESSLVAHFEYHTALLSSPRPAYVPVCASGAAGLTLHYTSNSAPLLAGDLVVLDAGCEYAGYASDITRTFPVSSTFSTAQKHLYEAVLRVQKACIKFCTEDKGMSMDELHRVSCTVMRDELRDLGFALRGSELERVLYPHFLCHPLGIDLHDTGSFGRDKPIKAGMVITIEPGICVPPHSSFPVGFHNLSVRVEDDILVREDDNVNLSVDAPKEVVDIEACCAGLLEAR